MTSSSPTPDLNLILETHRTHLRNSSSPSTNDDHAPHDLIYELIDSASDSAYQMKLLNDYKNIIINSHLNRTTSTSPPTTTNIDQEGDKYNLNKLITTLYVPLTILTSDDRVTVKLRLCIEGFLGVLERSCESEGDDDREILTSVMNGVNERVIDFSLQPPPAYSLTQSTLNLNALLHNRTTNSCLSNREVAFLSSAKEDVSPITSLIHRTSLAIYEHEGMLLRHSSRTLSSIPRDNENSTDSETILSIEATQTITSCTNYLEIMYDLLSLQAKAHSNNNSTKTTFNTNTYDVLKKAYDSTLLLLSCKSTNKDCLSKAGNVCGFLCYLILSNNDGVDDREFSKVSRIYSLLFSPSSNNSDIFKPLKLVQNSQLPLLSRVALLRGIVTSSPIHLLLSNEATAFFEEIYSYFVTQADLKGGEYEIKMYALQGVEGVCSRVLSYLKSLTKLTSSSSSSTNTLKLNTSTVEMIRRMTSILNKLVFELWDGSNRQIGIVLSNVFKSLVSFNVFDFDSLLAGGGDAGSGSESESAIEALVRSVLEMGNYRKGKFKSLLILLPQIPPTTLLTLLPTILPSLMSSITSIGDNANVASEVFLGVLKGLIVTVAVNTDSGGKKKKKKSKKKTDVLNDDDEQAPQLKPTLQPIFLKNWTTPIAHSLLSPNPRIRRRVIEYILTPFLVCAGVEQVPFVAVALLEDLKGVYEKVDDGGLGLDIKQWSCYERFLWGVIEITKQTHTLSHASKTNPTFLSTHSNLLPPSLLHASLTHAHDSIRLTSLECLTATPTVHTTPIDDETIEVLVRTVGYSFKVEGEVECGRFTGVVGGVLVRLACGPSSSSLSSDNTFRTFVTNLTQTLLTKTAYPHNALNKQLTLLSTLHSILTLLTTTTTAKLQMHVEWYVGVLCESQNFDVLFGMLNSAWDKARGKALALLRHVLKLALSSSSSSSTNTTDMKLKVPARLISKACMNRALFYASSPRQRESDSGAMMLRLLFLSRNRSLTFLTTIVRVLEGRVDDMSLAFGSVRSKGEAKRLPLAHGLLLGVRFCLEEGIASDDDDEEGGGVEAVNEVIRSIAAVSKRSIQLSLAVICDMKESGGDPHGDDTATGVNVSHSLNNITLNVNAGGCLGSNTSSVSGSSTSSASSGKGDNDDDSENQGRTGVQRIVVGSWLLAKEAAMALAQAVTYSYSSSTNINVNINIDATAVNEAGMLLLTTLTTLKHQGAAYAAQKALQIIAKYAYTHEETRMLPVMWCDHLVESISTKHTVHESTLRRSGGYAFAFLAVLRAEPRGSLPTTVTRDVIRRLIRLGLPCEKGMERHRVRLGLDKFEFAHTNNNNNNSSSSSSSSSDDDDESSTRSGESSNGIYVKSNEYDWKCRVHALNVLRLIILDAPLASEMRAFIGDALIVSLLAFSDSDKGSGGDEDDDSDGDSDGGWGVGNSGAMVYAAAMIRGVDRDKNATASVHSGSEGDGGGGDGEEGGERQRRKDRQLEHAVTARGLFRRFPALKGFLLAALRESLSVAVGDSDGDGSDSEKEKEKGRKLSPSTYPLLLLLSRLANNTGAESENSSDSTTNDDNKVNDSNSNSNSNSDEDEDRNVTQPFIPLVLTCLSHSHHKVRLMASLALAVVSDDRDKLGICVYVGEVTLNQRNVNVNVNCNEIHGALMGVERLIMSGFVNVESSIRVRDIVSYITMLGMSASDSNSNSGLPGAIRTVAIECVNAARVVTSVNSGYYKVVTEELKRLAEFVLKLGERSELNSSSSSSSGSSTSSSTSTSTSGSVIDVGLSHACSVAAAVLCRIGLEWDSASDSDFEEIRLVIVNCTLFDARTNGIKAVKKYIMNTTTSINNSTSNNNSSSSEKRMNNNNDKKTLKLAMIMKECLRSEISKSKPHAPTLRRVTRSIIELAYTNVIAILPHLFVTSELDNDWGLVCSVRDFSWISSSTSNQGEGFDGENSGNAINGNCVELMGLFLQRYMNITWFQTFASYAKDSCDPYGSWRVRHSISEAIGQSRCLQIIDTNTHDEDMKSLAVEMWHASMKLLQDNDVDVRRSIGRSIGSDVVEDLALEIGYNKITELVGLRLACKGVFEILARACTGIVDEFVAVCGESRCYGGEGEEDGDNLGGVRKIFEEEEVNIFEEKCTSVQVAVHCLIGGGGSNSGDSFKEMKGDSESESEDEGKVFTERLTSILDAAITAGPSATADSTYASSVFSKLHSLCIGFVLSLCVNGASAGEEEEERLEAVKSKVEMVLTKDENNLEDAAHMQPLSVVALKVVLEMLVERVSGRDGNGDGDGDGEAKKERAKKERVKKERAKKERVKALLFLV